MQIVLFTCTKVTHQPQYKSRFQFEKCK